MYVITAFSCVWNLLLKLSITLFPSIIVAQKVSVKRKRASDERRFSTSSSEDVADNAVGLSESELSESPSPHSCNQSAGEEEPPMKRKRDKALKKASERDRLHGRAKNGRSPNKLLPSRLQSNDKSIAQRLEEQNFCSVANASKENSDAMSKLGQANLEAETNVGRCNEVSHQLTQDSTHTIDGTSADISASDNTSKTRTESSVACPKSSDETVAASIDAKTGECSVSDVGMQNVWPSSNSETATDRPLGEKLLDLKTDSKSEVGVGGEVSDSVIGEEGKTIEEACRSSVSCTETTDSEICKDDASKSVETSESDKTNSAAIDDVKIVMDCVLDALDANQKETLDAAVAESKCETSAHDRSGDTIVGDNDIDASSQLNGDSEKERAENTQNENANDTVITKKTPQRKTGRRGKKKRGRPSKTSAVRTADTTKMNGETPKKTGRPRKVKAEQEVQVQVQEEQESQPLSEDDIPLIELRRSARANKGVRKLEQIAIERTKKRNRKEEEKERKKAEKEEKRRKQEADLQQQAALKAKKVYCYELIANCSRVA
jgi:hypothetical protein